MSETQRGILVVSFGTSYADTCKKTIDRIEDEMREAFPACRVFRAWTSRMIRSKLQKRDGIVILGVTEALEQMSRAGIRDVVVQPTHMLNGRENEQMLAEAGSCRSLFERMAIGAPVLTSQEDHVRVLRTVAGEFYPAADEALVLMGHGTDHFSNSVYAALDYQFKDLGYPNIFMGTVEAYPSLETLIRQIGQKGYRKVKLAPFMIVAGDHANNDLAGDEEDSWKRQFEQAGFAVSCELRGLGEFPGIRRLIVDHAAAVCMEE